MIVVTGAAGFIGSVLVKALKSLGKHIVVVDNFKSGSKFVNLRNDSWDDLVDLSNFHDWLHRNAGNVEFVFHLGAKTDTTTSNTWELDALNYRYSMAVWEICANRGIPLVYASSAATYGLSTHFDDGRLDLHPINKYAESKHKFDVWATTESPFRPPRYYGLKFFNVYGPNEYHKGKMASVIYHFYNQLLETRKIKLYKSYLPECQNGEQKRDFIYVRDVVDVMLFFLNKNVESGIYNVGTGQAESYNTLASLVALHSKSGIDIEYIDMPDGLREQYQYFTQANISKLRSVGYTQAMTSLYDGTKDYIGNHLDGRYV